MTDVTICICTYQRRELLTCLLESLCRLGNDGPTFAVVIVDNDPSRTAEPIVRTYLAQIPELQYACQPTRSISAARNLSVEIARDRTDSPYIGFLDDDEQVDPGWLKAMCRAIAEFGAGAGAVAGPVEPTYESGVAEWVIRGGLWERPSYRRGELAPRRSIANVMVPRAVFESIPDPFGTSFVRPGGEDSFFLLRLERLGIVPRWCDDAIVYEWIPLGRTRARYMLERAYHAGITTTECVRALDGTRRASVGRVVKCLIRIVEGSVLAVALLPRGRARSLSALRMAAAALGGLRPYLARGLASSGR